HCLRALHHVRLGAHGLPLIGTGDWNDALNRVGSEGKGESVWLGFFYAYVLEAYAPLCQDDDRAALESQRARVLDHADQDGWDGAWYRRAWSDDGTVLGSQQSPECRIDVIVQSWAVLAGAPDAQAREAMRQALSQLVDSSLGIIKLLWPPFDGILSPGYIRGYLPGVRENGGQYTHGAIWAVLACLRLGWQEEAWRLYRMLLPLSHSRNRAAADQYRVEPYVVAADVYANDQQAGRGGWTWYTGSAAWLYLAGLEGLLGFEKQGMRVRLCATLPQDWPGFSIDYRLGKTVYVLRVLRDCAFPQADGLALPDDWLTLADDGATHEAVWPPHLT
ncbi:MAG: cyclic beta 1-2 glucan synthetase, partial [Clostridia bacterium]